MTIPRILSVLIFIFPYFTSSAQSTGSGSILQNYDRIILNNDDVSLQLRQYRKTIDSLLYRVQFLEDKVPDGRETPVTAYQIFSGIPGSKDVNRSRVSKRDAKERRRYKSIRIDEKTNEIVQITYGSYDPDNDRLQRTPKGEILIYWQPQDYGRYSYERIKNPFIK